MTNENVEAIRKERDEAVEKVAELEVVKAEKSALNATATKGEKVEAAREAAEARAALTAAKRELAGLEKELAKAEKQAEKDAKAEAARAAAEERAEQRRIREQLAQSDPLMAFEVNYSALGAWVSNKAKGRACFVEGAGWGEWTGTHWQFSDKPSAELLSRVRRLYATETGDVADKLNANARSAEYILDHAKADLTVPRERFNSFSVAHIVAFKNVTVDLKTGETMPHDPEHYMTGALNCDYDPGADLDRVLRTFARFWPEDPDTAEMFQIALGYSLTGEVAAKRSFFMVGDQDDSNSNGDNGKSLVQNAISKLFGIDRGGWGTSVKPGLIIDTGDRDANSHDGAKTPLIWKRMAMSSEPRKGAAIESGEFNRLSGGDWQSARPPHGTESVQFVNFASLWISLNNMIRFRAFDRATKVRLTPFPFTESFYDPGTAPEGYQEKELGLKEWIEGEAGQQALALYVVHGAKKYYDSNDGKAGNFPDSDRVAEEREKLLDAANPFNEMFEDWLEFSPLADTRQTAINKLMELHIGARPKEWEKAAFYEALKGRGCVFKKNKGTRVWRGVGLTASGRTAAQRFGYTHPDVWRKPGGDVRQFAAE
ncbi:DNA primase family protein [Roseovarius sp.]|uniref:DNA primase family protein n=1 Tax=Roseovarius sp. TaxID=1486281 RepID=UPI003B5C77FD